MTDQIYDVILVDAYQDITIPFQMSSIEFFTLVKEHLKPDGVMAVNMNMRGKKEGNINQYLADTISNVFEEVYVTDVLGSTNRLLYASGSNQILERLAKNREMLADAQLSEMMERVASGLENYQAGGYLMTDEKAPVEVLGMQAIDGLIQNEIGYYKKVFEKKGISGLLNEMR